MNRKEQLRALSANLKDRPLSPDHEFYVDFLAQSGDDPIAVLADRILLDDGQSTHLLSGPRGTGKSTEMRRLRDLLQNAGHSVLYCDMEDYLNMSDAPEVSDFLLVLMAAFGKAVEEELQLKPLRESYGQRLENFLNSEVDIKDAKLGGATGLTLSLRNDPSFKHRVQEALRGHAGRLVQEAHDFCKEVAGTVRNNLGADTKLILLVDSLEHIQGIGADAKHVYEAVVNLFAQNAHCLMLPGLHVVYSIPPYVIPLQPNIARLLGGNPITTLPSVHVRRRDSGEADPAGLALMEAILAKRCPDWRQVLRPEHLQRLAMASGGDLRDFFRLLRDTLVRALQLRDDQFPVPESLVEAAENQLRREMLPIAKADARWLARIHRSKRSELDKIDDLQQLARFFDTNLAINYRNGDDWYDIHPLIVEEVLRLAGDGG